MSRFDITPRIKYLILMIVFAIFIYVGVTVIIPKNEMLGWTVTIIACLITGGLSRKYSEAKRDEKDAMKNGKSGSYKPSNQKKFPKF